MTYGMVYLSGLSGRHMVSYFIKCSEFKSYMEEQCVHNPKIFVLILGELCVFNMYVCKVPQNTGCIMTRKIMWIRYSLSDPCEFFILLFVPFGLYWLK